MLAVLFPYLMGNKVISSHFAMSFTHFYPKSMPYHIHSEIHIIIQSKFFVCLRINYGAVLKRK